MDAHLSCPRGHCWPLPDARVGASSLLLCPVCGPIAAARLSEHDGAAADSLPGDQPTVRLRTFPRACRDAPQVAGYEVLCELGRGGMGVVYQARQLKLNRVVALKMILDDCRDRPPEYARFLSEAEVIAGLNHPNIVQIHEIGEADGRPFFSLEFVAGGSLAQRLRGSDPLPPRQAARLIADLARGVDAAHRQGVVHRDLKPANVLLAGAADAPLGECTPKITDFGLAKRRGEGVKTTAGFILGTPCYMAPEQAAGRAEEVGPASDVYSLGAIFYELLTGRPPFQDDAPLVTLQRVLSEDPVAPSQLGRRAPDDLEIICLKCLQKQPPRRYPAAAALADDLERFLEGRPIQARPAAAAERLVKWTRRRPATAAFLGVSLLALLLMLAGGLWHTFQLHDALAAADRARIDAQTERDASLRARNLAQERERLVRQYVYAVQVRQAQQLWFHADLTPMRELLAPYAEAGDSDPREFTWRYLWRLCHGDRRTLEGHTSDVYFVAYSPDGGRLVSAGRDGVLHLWDPTTGRDLHTLVGHDKEVNSAAFSPDGAGLVSVGDDGRIVLWDVETGRERLRLQDSGAPLQTAAWSPDGRLIAAAGRDRLIHLWDVGAGRQLAPLAGHADQVESVAFTGDGRALASGGRDGGVFVWDLDRMAPSRKLDTEARAVQTVAWSRDGRRLAAACGDGTVRLWDADTWAPRPALDAHLGEAQGVAFSPDGATLATCGNDHLVCLFDLEKNAPRIVFRGHGDRVWSVAFAPDGKTLASAGRDRVVKLWDPERRQDSQVLPADGGSVGTVAVSPHDDVLALGMADGSIRLRPVHADGPTDVLPPQCPSPVVALAYSADGRRLGAQAGDGTVVVWDVTERRPRLLRSKTAVTFVAISFSADGGALACQAPDGSVQLWDAATGDVLPSPVAPGKACTCLAFSPTGSLLAVALKEEYVVILYDWRTGKEQRQLWGHRAAVACMTFTADGKTLATGSEDQTAKLWDVQAGREKAGLLGHTDAVLAIAIAPGGKTIATGGADHQVVLWDTVTGQELAVFPGQAGRVKALGFTPDGDALITAAGGQTADEVRLWSAATPAEPRP